ncbi:MAG: hypothetical protein Q8K72_16350, partial [Acidimicrobiales bacterium]|nr:hypothetical protein [Acidimicrobiales bacterium]
PAAARRAGRLGDGFFPLGLSGDVLTTRWQQVQQAATDSGRDSAAIGLTLGGLLGDDAPIEAAVERGAERVVLSTRTGDLPELRDAMDQAVAVAQSLT